MQSRRCPLNVRRGQEQHITTVSIFGMGGLCSGDGQILTTYLHGVFEFGPAADALLRWAGMTEPQSSGTIPPYAKPGSMASPTLLKHTSIWTAFSKFSNLAPRATLPLIAH